MQNTPHPRKTSWPHSISTGIGVALLLGNAACSDSDGAIPATGAAPDGPLEREPYAILEAHRAQREFPGAVMALHDPLLGDALVTSGTTGPGSDATPVDPDVPWIIGSATKTFVAIAVLQLAEEGKLDLDASIVPYFRDLPRAAEITPRQLLQHTSGLNEYFDSPTVLADTGRFWSPRELIDSAVALGPVGDPGSGHHYANTNYIVLGELIQRVSGVPWYDAVRERVLGPLGMRHTHYAGEQDAPPTGPGFSIEAGDFVDSTAQVDASLGGAAGALQSTAADLLLFARALLEHTLLDEQRYTEMLAFVPGEPRGYVGHEYGLGFERYVVNDLTLEGHAGTAPAHASFVGFEPETGLAVAVLINSSEPASAPLMAIELAGALTGKDVRPPAEAAPSTTAE